MSAAGFSHRRRVALFGALRFEKARGKVEKHRRTKNAIEEYVIRIRSASDYCGRSAVEVR